jgi:hypothetical protein
MTRKELNEWLDKLDWGSYEILSDENGHVRVLISIDDEDEDND